MMEFHGIATGDAGGIDLKVNLNALYYKNVVYFSSPILFTITFADST